MTDTQIMDTYLKKQIRKAESLRLFSLGFLHSDRYRIAIRPQHLQRPRPPLAAFEVPELTGKGSHKVTHKAHTATHALPSSRRHVVGTFRHPVTLTGGFNLFDALAEACIYRCLCPVGRKKAGLQLIKRVASPGILVHMNLLLINGIPVVFGIGGIRAERKHNLILRSPGHHRQGVVKVEPRLVRHHLRSSQRRCNAHLLQCLRIQLHFPLALEQPVQPDGILRRPVLGIKGEGYCTKQPPENIQSFHLITYYLPPHIPASTQRFIVARVDSPHGTRIFTPLPPTAVTGGGIQHFFIRKEIDSFVVLGTGMHHLAAHGSVMPQADSFHRPQDTFAQAQFAAGGIRHRSQRERRYHRHVFGILQQSFDIVLIELGNVAPPFFGVLHGVLARFELLHEKVYVGMVEIQCFFAAG